MNPYAKITFDGSWVICELCEAIAYTQDLESADEGFTVEIVHMTLEEFEALPEFEGW